MHLHLPAVFTVANIPRCFSFVLRIEGPETGQNSWTKKDQIPFLICLYQHNSAKAKSHSLKISYSHAEQMSACSWLYCQEKTPKESVLTPTSSLFSAETWISNRGSFLASLPHLHSCLRAGLLQLALRFSVIWSFVDPETSLCIWMLRCPCSMCACVHMFCICCWAAGSILSVCWSVTVVAKPRGSSALP